MPKMKALEWHYVEQLWMLLYLKWLLISHAFMPFGSLSLPPSFLSVATSPVCDFDHGLCGWTHDPNAPLLWSLHSHGEFPHQSCGDWAWFTATVWLAEWLRAASGSWSSLCKRAFDGERLAGVVLGLDQFTKQCSSGRHLKFYFPYQLLSTVFTHAAAGRISFGGQMHEVCFCKLHRV